MLEYIALILIALGAFLLIQGLRERYVSDEVYYIDRPEPEEEMEMLDLKDEWRSKLKGGGVILIGPIPIVFGDSRYAVIALVLTIFLMILAIAFMVMV